MTGLLNRPSNRLLFLKKTKTKQLFIPTIPETRSKVRESERDKMSVCVCVCVCGVIWCRLLLSCNLT